MQSAQGSRSFSCQATRMTPSFGMVSPMNAYHSCQSHSHHRDLRQRCERSWTIQPRLCVQAIPLNRLTWFQKLRKNQFLPATHPLNSIGREFARKETRRHTFTDRRWRKLTTFVHTKSAAITLRKTRLVILQQQRVSCLPVGRQKNGNHRLTGPASVNKKPTNENFFTEVPVGRLFAFDPGILRVWICLRWKSKCPHYDFEESGQ